MPAGPIATKFGAWTYVTTAASQTTAQLTTRTGTLLKTLIIQPETTSPGNVILYDGVTGTPTTIYTFPGGASSVNELRPIVIHFDMVCKGAGDTKGFHITTGANVNTIAIVQDG